MTIHPACLLSSYFCENHDYCQKMQDNMAISCVNKLFFGIILSDLGKTVKCIYNIMQMVIVCVKMTCANYFTLSFHRKYAVENLFLIL